MCVWLRLLIGSGPSAPQCLTCELHPDRCQYNSAYFSADASYYRMDCYGESARLLASMCERSSEEPSNLLFVHLPHQDLVCLSTPSETTGAQVQVSVSFAQARSSAAFRSLSAPPPSTHIPYSKYSTDRLLFFLVCFSRACSSWRQQGTQRNPVRVPNANSAVRHAKDRRVWWDPPCWHLKRMELFPTWICKATATLMSSVLSPDLWYQMTLPPNFKKSKKYPLLIEVWVANPSAHPGIPLLWFHHLCCLLQVRRPLQPAGQLQVQVELGHVPLQFTRDYFREFWRKGKWIPGRRNTALDLQAARNAGSGRPDYSCEVEVDTLSYSKPT